MRLIKQSVKQLTNKFVMTLAIALSTMLAGNSAMAVEEAQYDVLETHGNIEIRAYAPQVVVQVTNDASFEKAGNKAFRPLFNFISGQNSKQQEIAMTAPVHQSQNENGRTVNFVMPASFNIENTPLPDNKDVQVIEIAPRTMASIRYSGRWTKSGYDKHLAKLQEWIAQSNYTAIGEPIWARYNQPFSLWFMRRNEVLIPVVKK